MQGSHAEHAEVAALRAALSRKLFGLYYASGAASDHFLIQCIKPTAFNKDRKTRDSRLKHVEWVGDAVLDLTIAYWFLAQSSQYELRTLEPRIRNRAPTRQYGRPRHMYQALVANATLTTIYDRLGLERCFSGRQGRRVRADVIELLVGTQFLDCSYASAARLTHLCYLSLRPDLPDWMCRAPSSHFNRKISYRWKWWLGRRVLRLAIGELLYRHSTPDVKLSSLTTRAVRFIFDQTFDAKLYQAEDPDCADNVISVLGQRFIEQGYEWCRDTVAAAVGDSSEALQRLTTRANF